MSHSICHFVSRLSQRLFFASFAIVLSANTLFAQSQPNQALPTSIAEAPANAAAQQPFPPLAGEMVIYLDKVLAYWSSQTASIERYRCDFTRWSFDGQSAVHSQYAQGVLRFMKPDKGMIRVDDLYFYQGPNAQPAYSKRPGFFGEWWICDGQRVHNYDRTQKVVERTMLPPEMQGAQVYNSPLPFLFGVDAKTVKDRYWLQPIAPPNDEAGNPRQDIVALEAFPKFINDAQNYLKVRIYLDREQFLPKSIEIFQPNWTEKVDSREVYEFNNREVNWTWVDRINEVLKFKEAFIPQEPEKGWTVIDTPIAPPPAAPGDRMATPPSADGTRR